MRHNPSGGGRDLTIEAIESCRDGDTYIIHDWSQRRRCQDIASRAGVRLNYAVLAQGPERFVGLLKSRVKVDHNVRPRDDLECKAWGVVLMLHD